MSTKLATSATKEGIINLLNQYCYSQSCNIDFNSGECFNAKGLIKHLECVHKKGRYILITI